MDFVVAFALALLIVRVGRFFAVPRRKDHSFLLCYDIGRFDYHGVYCTRFRGHWGSHRTDPQGALMWYYEWRSGKEQKSVGL